MQAAFGIRHGPIKLFFDSEVIFHVLFLLGTEEFTIYDIINNFYDLRTPLFSYLIINSLHAATIWDQIWNHEKIFWFRGEQIFTKGVDWSLIWSKMIDSSRPNINNAWKIDFLIKNIFLDLCLNPNAGCMQRFES